MFLYIWLISLMTIQAATTCKYGSASVSLTTGLPITQIGQDWGTNGTACNSDSTVCRTQFIITKSPNIIGRTLFAECVNAIDCTVGFKNESVLADRWTWTQTKCCDTNNCNSAPEYIVIAWEGGSGATSAPTSTSAPSNTPTTIAPSVAPTANNKTGTATITTTTTPQQTVATIIVAAAVMIVACINV